MAVAGILLASAAHILYAQSQEFPNRLHFEDDWYPWKKALKNPDSAQKVYIYGHDSVPEHRLKQFKNLKGLIIRDTPIRDLDFLHNFPQLEILELFGNSLRTTAGLDSMKNLTDLTINHNFIDDVELIPKLTNLVNLQLYDNELRDVRSLGSLTKLKYLDLGNNMIESIDELKNLRNLIGFSIYKCSELTNIEVISNFEKLKFLNISLIGIKDFSLKTISHMDSMDNLRVQGMVHHNDELNHIKHMTSMTQLTMGINDKVTNIDSLKYLVNMEYLDIHSDNITDISVVTNFPKLIKLVAYRNKIEDVTPLLKCKELGSLFLFENPVKDYKPLLQMKQLQYLDVNKEDFTPQDKNQLKRALSKTKVSFL